MSHSPFTPATADALAAGRALVGERSAEQRKIAALPRWEAAERVAAALEGDGPSALQASRVLWLLRKIPAVGTGKAWRVLEAASIDDDRTRVRQLSADQRRAAAAATRALRGPRVEPEPVPTCGKCGDDLREPAPLCGFCVEEVSADGRLAELAR